MKLTMQEARAIAARRAGHPVNTLTPPQLSHEDEVLPLSKGEYAFILRRRARLSMKDVAEALGVSAVTIGHWERGIKGDPTPEINLLEKEHYDALPPHSTSRRIT